MLRSALLFVTMTVTFLCASQQPPAARPPNPTSRNSTKPPQRPSMTLHVFLSGHPDPERAEQAEGEGPPHLLLLLPLLLPLLLLLLLPLPLFVLQP
jgi:hypothetical protein